MQTLNTTSHGKIKEVENLFVQGEYEKSLEQVRNLKKNQSLDKTSTFDLLVLEGKILNELDNRVDSLKLAETAIKLAQSMEDSEKELYALLLKSSCLINLESVIDKDKELPKADDLINEIENLYDSLSDLKEEAIKSIRILINIQKGVLYYFKGDFQKAEKLYMESYQELRKGTNIADRIEVLIRLSYLHQWASNSDKAIEFSEEWLQLTRQTNNKRDLLQIYGIQSVCYIEKGNHEKAIKILLEARKLLHFIDSERLKAANSGYLSYAYLVSGDFNLSLKFGLEALESSENVSDHFMSFWFNIILGKSYLHIGELDNALKHANNALAIRKAGAWKMAEARALTLIGDIYQLKGEYDETIGSYNQALLLFKEEKIIYLAALTHYAILNVYNDLNKIEEASHHLEEIRKISSETDNDVIKQISLMSEALLNKAINTPRLRGKAESLFEQILTFPSIAGFLKIKALINLCEILLVEVTETSESELLTGINDFVSQLEEIAISQKNNILLAETYWIQSKIALIELDIPSAKRKLTAAQKIAVETGYDKLVTEIKSEVEGFQEKLTFWKDIKQQKPSIKETIKHAQLDEVFRKLNRERRERIDSKETSTEMLRKLFVLKI